MKFSRTKLNYSLLPILLCLGINTSSAQEQSKSFSDPDQLFTARLPLNWQSESTNVVTRFSLHSNAHNEKKIVMQVNNLDRLIEDMKVQELGDGVLDDLKKKQKKGKLIVNKSDFPVINGTQWFMIDFTEKNTRSIYYLTIIDKKKYKYFYTAPLAEFDQDISTAESTIYSIQFGKISVTNPSYYIEINVDEVEDFKGGFALVRKENGYAFIKPDGKLLDNSHLYNYNMGINKRGQTDKLQDACGFYYGITVVKDKQSGKYGYMDSTGRIIVPCILTHASHFEEDGYAFASISDIEHSKYYEFYFDKNGKRYQVPKGIRDLYFTKVTSMDGKTTKVYRKNTTEAFETTLRFSKNYRDGYLEVFDFKNQKTGFTDTTGSIRIPMVLGGNVEPFSDGLALVISYKPSDSKYTFINKAGTTVIKLKDENGIQFRKVPEPFLHGFSECEIYSNGDLANVLIDKTGALKNIQKSFIDANQQYMNSIVKSDSKAKNYIIDYIERNAAGILVKCTFRFDPDAPILKQFPNKKSFVPGGVQSASGPAKGYVEVTGIGMIDYDGKVLIPPAFEFIGPLDPVSGLAKAARYNNDKKLIQGFINRSGEFVIIQKTNLGNF